MNIFVNTTGRSAKVWGYDLFVPNEHAKPGALHTIIWWWGTIGKRMNELTKKEIKYDSYWAAHDAIKDKIDEKLRNGYFQIERYQYQQILDTFREELDKLMHPEDYPEKEKPKGIRRLLTRV
jgi:hypothetical protein